MGLILVFDMDGTITDSSDRRLFKNPTTPEEETELKSLIKSVLNMNVVNIMLRAARLRYSNVDAICLLTNSNAQNMVLALDSVLLELSGASKGKYKTINSKNTNARKMPEKEYFFDSIFMRSHITRKKPIDNPPKSIEDVKNMMAFLNSKGDLSYLIKNTYFFDDIPNHDMKEEFKILSRGTMNDHYITITPPYSVYESDRTNYTSILNALSVIDGQPATLPPVDPPLPLANLGEGRLRANARTNENIESLLEKGGSRRLRNRRRYTKKRR